MILHRWRLVNGCIEWFDVLTSRYVGPAVRGLPSLGPCVKAGALAVPLLAVPGGAIYPYARGTGLHPVGDTSGRGEGLYVVPGNILAPGGLPVLSVPLRSPSGPGSQWGEHVGLAPRLPQVPITATFLPAGVPAAVPPVQAIPEPASIVLVGVGAGAAILARRRK